MRLADSFAERSGPGSSRAVVGAWLLVGLPVIAARIWLSATCAIAVFSRHRGAVRSAADLVSVPGGRVLEAQWRVRPAVRA